MTHDLKLLTYASSLLGRFQNEHFLRDDRSWEGSLTLKGPITADSIPNSWLATSPWSTCSQVLHYHEQGPCREMLCPGRSHQGPEDCTREDVHIEICHKKQNFGTSSNIWWFLLIMMPLVYNEIEIQIYVIFLKFLIQHWKLLTHIFISSFKN